MKNKTFLLIFAISLCNVFNSSAQEKKTIAPTLINLNYEDLLRNREDLRKGKPETAEAFNKIIKKADKKLSTEPLKVTDGAVPPTGDIHDFFTIGKYSWKNTETKDGLPYIRKDGATNPESQGDNYDMNRYGKTVSYVNQLSLAWFFSEDEKYAKKAAEILRVWFINPQTRMNPNFECASALPGKFNGMPIGIIFGAQLVKMIDNVNILSMSNNWTKEDNNSLKKWFDDYSAWLLMSDYGVIEGKATNNHGTWYSAQVAACAIYNGRLELAKSMIEKGKTQLNQQVAKDGSLPRELDRKQSFNYSIYGLSAFCTLAGCANAVGEDLWNYQTTDGRGIKLAFNFLIPYIVDGKKWEWETLTDAKGTEAVDIITQAARALGTEDLKRAEKFINATSPLESDKVWLLGRNKK